MQTAIITLSKSSRELGLKIKKRNKSCVIYTMPRFKSRNTKAINGAFSEFIGDIFSKYNTLVFIMATGIVVRAIAPYLKHKSVDPAVLVVDNNGEYVISLLSGHLGGANQKAIELAQSINATPIITTASDLSGKLAVDMLAKENNLIIKDFNQAKSLTALILNDEPVAIVTAYQLKTSLPSNVKVLKRVSKNYSGLIFINNQHQLPNLKQEMAHLIMPNIVIGIGCRKGISCSRLVSIVLSRLQELNISPHAVAKIASIELKKDEPAILALVNKLQAKYLTYSVHELLEVEHLFVGSQFVKKSIGVSSVCEPSGYLASRQGRCLFNKEKHQGITISIWEEQEK